MSTTEAALGSSVSTGIGLGVVASLLWAIAPAARIGAGALEYVALAGCAALLMTPVVAAARAARPLSPAGLGGLLGVVVSLGPLAVFGALLSAKTHHRPLGGVTFALGATLVLVFAAWFGARLWSLGQERSLARTIARRFVAFAALASVALALRMVWSSLSPSTPIGAALVDGALGVTLAAVASRERLVLPAAVTKAAPIAWVILVVVGLFLVRADEDLYRRLVSGAPVTLGVGLWLGS